MKHRIFRACWTILVTLVVLASAAAAQTACNIGYAITSQWPGGFGAAITINNTGTTALSSWTLTWTFANGQTISSLWNGAETQSGANVTVKNLSYNGSIPAGGSLSGIGFNGTWNNSTNAVPTSFALNGTICGTAAGSFTLKSSASTLTVTQGSSVTDTLSVTDVSPFVGSVALTTSALPSGVTATFGTNPTTGSSVLTFTTSSTATVGTSTVTITGTSGTLTATTAISLTVVARTTPGFTLSISPASLTVPQCGIGTFTLTVTAQNGFTGTVVLSGTGLPSGVSIGFGTNPITAGASTLTISVGCSTPPGTYTLTIVGTSGSITSTTTITLIVTAAGAGSFTLSSSAPTLTLSPSAGATDTINITDVGGFTGSVTLTASGMPSGVIASFGTNPTTSSSVLTLTASSTASPGTSTITIQGTSTGTASGTLSAATTIALTVSATPLVQIAWISPSAGIPGSSMTIMPGVGASFAETQGASTVYFGTTAATVTTWAIDSVTVTVPSLPVGVVNVTAVVNGVTSNAVPFTVTTAIPSPEIYTGNSTWFTGLGGPYGGCGVPQANLDSQNFIALNVQNDPGNYSLELTRPISSQYASDIGLWNNGLNCGRWVHVVMGDNCEGTNDGNQYLPFCRGGLGWVSDQFTGASLDMVVADSCQDGNAWCRDDPYHIDQAQAALNNYVLNGQPVGDLYPNFWNNRQVSWYFEPAPNYTGDINIGFLNGANAYWSAISITHLQNGIHGVQYLLNGVWTTAVMDADLGDDYIILPTVTAGTQYEIQVFDVTGALINGGRIYSFTYPASCGSGCTPALTPITYTTSTPAAATAAQ